MRSLVKGYIVEISRTGLLGASLFLLGTMKLKKGKSL